MFQPNAMGHEAYKYAPSWQADIERHPDKRPSASRMLVVDRGKEGLVWLLEVRGCGAIVMRAASSTQSGRLHFQGVSLFTDEEIQFEPRA